MNKDSIKKILSGIGIAGLVASVGVTMSACKKAGSCGKGSCSGKNKPAAEEMMESGSCGKGSCGGGEKKTEEKK